MQMRAMRSYLRTWGLAVVRGRSMQPTFHDGDRLLVRHGRLPRAGDVVVVRFTDGVVAIKRATFHGDDGWWVERDNPREGVDSWTLGAIPEADVLAVVQARVWPPRRASQRHRKGNSRRHRQRHGSPDRGCIDLDD